MKTVFSAFIALAAVATSLGQPIPVFYNNASPAGLTQEGLRTGPRPAGGGYSEVQAPNLTVGYNCNLAVQRLGDDFVVPGYGAFLDSVNVFCYVIGTNPALVSGGTLQVRSGSETGPIVATGTFDFASFTTLYRISTGVPSDNRRIQWVQFDTPNTFLPSGTYWITYDLTHPSTTNIFTPTLTKVGAGTTAGADAKLRLTSAGVWSAITDIGGPQDLPFWLEGTDCTGNLYAYDTTGRMVHRVNPANGTGQVLATLSAGVPTLGSLAFDWNRNVLHASSTSTHTLNVLLPSWNLTLVGNYNIGTPFMHGIEYHEAQDSMFGVQSNAGGNNLYRINRTTGAATLIGTTGVAAAGFRALCYVPVNNTMYMVDNGTDSLYTINMTTGAASLVAPLTGPLATTGLAWNQELNRMYLIEGSGNLWTVNRTTGVCTAVGDVGSGNFLGLAYVGQEELQPYATQTLSGIPFGGNNNSLRTSDNDKYFTLFDENEPNGMIRSFFEFCSNDFRRVYVTIESSATRDDLTEFVDLTNHSSGSSQNIGFSSPGFADSTIRFTALGNQWGSSTYVVTCTVRYIPQTDIETADGWSTAIDFLGVRLIH